MNTERGNHNPSLHQPPAIRVLMVEDCEGDVFLLKEMLCQSAPDNDYQITNAPRLIDAFHHIEHNSFDLVLLDLNLPDMDGIACVTAIRAQLPNIPLIVYSGMDDSRLRDDALRCGATHYLVKGKESAYSMKFMIDSTLANKK